MLFLNIYGQHQLIDLAPTFLCKCFRFLFGNRASCHFNCNIAVVLHLDVGELHLSILPAHRLQGLYLQQILLVKESPFSRHMKSYSFLRHHDICQYSEQLQLPIVAILIMLTHIYHGNAHKSPLWMWNCLVQESYVLLV